VTVKYVFAPPVARKKYLAGITPRVVVFVPVPGQIVFAVCVLLIVAIFFLWFLPLCRKGKKFNEEN